MVNLWIVENDKKTMLELDQKLSGSFALRKFHSFDSYRTMLLESNEHDFALIAVISIDILDRNNALFNKCKKLLSIPILVLCPKHQVALSQEKTLETLFPIGYLDSNEDGFQMYKKVVDYTLLVSSIKKKTSDLVYNGVALNIYKNQIKCIDSDLQMNVTPTEAKLLKILLSNPQKTITRQSLMNQIWEEVAISERTLDSHISRLRKRLLETPLELKSVYNRGYLLV